MMADMRGCTPTFLSELPQRTGVAEQERVNRRMPAFRASSWRESGSKFCSVNICSSSVSIVTTYELFEVNVDK